VKTCIICLSNNQPESVEHIVPRALGNIHYVLPKGKVCKRCNNRFSRSEHAVMNSQAWLAERRKFGLISDRSTVHAHDLEEHHLIRTLIKIYYESLFHSRKSVWDGMDKEPMRSYLAQGKNITTDLYEQKTIKNARPIPRWLDRWRLGRNHIMLSYLHGEDVNWFTFSFGKLHYLLKIS